MRMIAAALACAFLAGPALAKDAPSYEETVKFIQAKTLVTMTGWEDQKYEHRIEETGHCQFVYVSHLIATRKTDYWRTGPASNERLFFDLSKFDPSRVEIGGGVRLILHAKIVKLLTMK